MFQPESSAAQKVVSVEPTLVEEEVNDDDHEASDQVTIEPRRSTRMRTTPEWYGNPILEVMLLDNVLEICPRGNNKLVIIIFPCS